MTYSGIHLKIFETKLKAKESFKQFYKLSIDNNWKFDNQRFKAVHSETGVTVLFICQEMCVPMFYDKMLFLSIEGLQNVINPIYKEDLKERIYEFST